MYYFVARRGKTQINLGSMDQMIDFLERGMDIELINTQNERELLVSADNFRDVKLVDVFQKIKDFDRR